MTIYWSLLVALVGLVMYFVATNPKVQEVGRIFLWTGVLAFLLQQSPHVATVLR